MIDGGVIDRGGYRGVEKFSASNNLCCFTGIFTELSESKLPNSMATGVT